MRNKTKIKYKSDRVYYGICYTVVILLTLIVLYPVIYIVSASFSNADAVIQGRVVLFPVDISLEAYKIVFKYRSLWSGYANTIFYTFVGTIVNLTVTLMCAYPMARKNLRFKGQIMFLFSFTMLFGGGMVPNYILVRSLGLLNSRWALIIPGAMSVYNMIVARTFIQTNIPDEMLEASKIDGCDDINFFFKIVMPLIKPVIAVLTLWYAVGHWNSYFGAFLYLSEEGKYPLQIFLREILVQSQKITESEEAIEEISSRSPFIYVTMKYCVIIVSSAPLFVAYPFVQKYFQKGVLLGSVKG